MGNMKVKGVAFNLDDPDQVDLLNHAMQRPNFSSYIKRLIQRDMEGGKVQEKEVDFSLDTIKKLTGG